MLMREILESSERTNTYQKEKLKYIQGQNNKIRNSVKDKQLRLSSRQ